MRKDGVESFEQMYGQAWLEDVVKSIQKQVDVVFWAAAEGGLHLRPTILVVWPDPAATEEGPAEREPAWWWQTDEWAYLDVILGVIQEKVDKVCADGGHLRRPEILVKWLGRSDVRWW